MSRIATPFKTNGTNTGLTAGHSKSFHARLNRFISAVLVMMMVAVSSGVMTFAADTTSGSGSSTAAASSTTVQVTYNANRGTFKSGFNNKVSAAPGTHITLPGADAATLTGNQASHLAGWSTSSRTSVPEYKPGDDYVVPSSGVTLYAVWQKSLTLAPKLENMTAYYMVVDTSRNVLSEGPVNGATPVTAPGPQSPEAFVEVFVKPDPNYLITRIESADVNNFIYPLGDNYMGRPGQYLKKSDVQRMKDQGYVATFGWGTAYQKEGNNLTVDAKAIQPVPEAKIVPDKTQNLKKGDVVTLTVTLRAGDLQNQYSAALNGTPVVHIGKTSTTDIPLSNVKKTDNDTYTGTAQYTLTADDIKNNSLNASVEASFTYSYEFPFKGENNAQYSVTTAAAIDSSSDAIVIDGYAKAHKVSYNYSFLGGVTAPTGFPALPIDSTAYTKGNTVNISATPATGSTVRDDANSGTWNFTGWYLYDRLISGTTTMGDDDLNFEGRWLFKADTDTLTYDANSGSDAYEGATDPSQGYAGGIVNVKKNGFTRQGYRFTGWNTKADGTGTEFVPDSAYVLNGKADDVLYAQWEKTYKVNYQISYDGADGSDTSSFPAEVVTVPEDDKEYAEKDVVTVSAEPSQRKVKDPINGGTWTFSGWTLNGQPAGEKLTVGTEDITLTGTWTFTPDKKATPGDNTNSNSNTNSGSTTTTNAKITRTGDAQGTPRTGDDTAFELYAFMLGISGAALAAFGIARRRRNSTQEK